jgi:hypothetical protein
VVIFERQDEEAKACPPRTGASFVKPGRSLPSLAAELGDQVVELLKLDTEGREDGGRGWLDPLVLGVRVLCVELHHTLCVELHHTLCVELHYTVPLRVAKRHVARLRSLGYDRVYRGDPVELTFVRRP